MIFLAMDKLGISDPSAVGKIGDTIADIEEGLNAGCGMSAGITTGAQTAEQLRTANPTHVFNSLEEVLNYV
jgi:phosphoglycolate phosphatase-like HAD superfamily hydrolase